MSVFNAAERAYFDEAKLGRLATVDPGGLPHVVPLGWDYNEQLDVIDIGGIDLARTKKFRNVRRNPSVALVIDDVLPPWRPRGVLIRGQGEALDASPDTGDRPIIRIKPTEVLSWGLPAGESTTT